MFVFQQIYLIRANIKMANVTIKNFMNSLHNLIWWVELQNTYRSTKTDIFTSNSAREKGIESIITIKKQSLFLKMQSLKD